MDSTIQKKLDGVLHRVKEPESGLSLSQLGLVERFRYSAKDRRLIVFKSKIMPGKGCCTLISNMLLHSTLESLIKELQYEFPDFSIEVA
jgi:hypothetical protein